MSNLADITAVTVSIVGAAIAALSLLVSGFAAVTAFRGFRHLQRTSRTQLRAWVCYEEMGIEIITGTDGQPALAFRARWKNAGSTPGRSVQVFIHGMAFATAEQALAHHFAREELDTELSGIIGPGITLDSPTGTFRLTDFKSGSTIIWSSVTYKDIFSEEVHESEIRLLVRTHPRPDGATTFLWQAVGASKAT